MSHLDGELSKPVQLKHIINGVWKRNPHPLGEFFHFSAKKEPF